MDLLCGKNLNKICLASQLVLLGILMETGSMMLESVLKEGL